MIDFRLYAYISNRMLDKIVPAFFLAIIYSFFNCNNSTSFENVFCRITVKSTLYLIHIIFNTFKIYSKRRKLRVVFDPTLTFILPIFGDNEEGKLYMWKLLVLVHLRRYVCNSIFMFYFT